MLKNLIFVVLCCWLGFSTDFAEAQARREDLRRPPAPPRNPYWDGFILKQQGNCAGAVRKLLPIAQRGRGYEDAQTALGECLLQLAGLPLTEADPPARKNMFANDGFLEGLGWIGRAADSGNFTAQGMLVALYAINLGPSEDPIEGAKWAHLYITNPTRLNLGAPILAHASIDHLRQTMPKKDWLLGKERARLWSPTYPRRTTAPPELIGE